MLFVVLSTRLRRNVTPPGTACAEQSHAAPRKPQAANGPRHEEGNAGTWKIRNEPRRSKQCYGVRGRNASVRGVGALLTRI